DDTDGSGGNYDRHCRRCSGAGSIVIHRWTTAGAAGLAARSFVRAAFAAFTVMAASAIASAMAASAIASATMVASAIASAALAAGCSSCASYCDRANEYEICPAGFRGLTHDHLHKVRRSNRLSAACSQDGATAAAPRQTRD
ncbi:hypothetical protein, partial [Mesorhizobium sp.]|uniref:hypothetical protein n=1 Tax=Mesorhizobium sp. TaxID=1871066 RepID=UPI00257D9BE8